MGLELSEEAGCEVWYRTGSGRGIGSGIKPPAMRENEFDDRIERRIIEHTRIDPLSG